jgi:FixJ family two-component response regulator
VFVVDDNAAVRDSIAELAEFVGLQAECYPSALALLDAFQPQRPGCLVPHAKLSQGDCVADKTIYIISEDSAVRDSLAELVASADLAAATLPSVEAWLATAEPEAEGCLVLDAGAELVEPERLARFAAACARIPVLVLIDHGDVPTGVRAIKHGAAEVLQKP